MDQLNGFANLYLGLEPSLDNVMDPIVIAKYHGFLVAREVSPSTIQTNMSHIKQATILVASKHIPNTSKYSSKYSSKVWDWLTNEIAKLEAQVKSSPNLNSSLHHAITLHDVWGCTKMEIKGFMDDFEVSSK